MSIFADAEWLLPLTPIPGERSGICGLGSTWEFLRMTDPSQMYIIIIVIQTGISCGALWFRGFFVILFFCVDNIFHIFHIYSNISDNIFHYVAKLKSCIFYFLCCVILKALFLLQTLSFILYFSWEGCGSPGWNPAFLVTNKQDLSSLKTFLYIHTFLRKHFGSFVKYLYFPFGLLIMCFFWKHLRKY